jgi:TorA maturation chaperone TorD
MPTAATIHDPALLLARRACYRFAALALADPRTGSWNALSDPETQALVTQAAEVIRNEDAAVARPLGLGELPLAQLDPALVISRLPRTAGALNELYEATFGLLGGSKCPPYETEYVPSKFAFQRSNMLADVAGFYHAFGLQTSTSHPDRPDHAALECEFLAQLLELQWRAGQSDSPNAASQEEVSRLAIERFLKEHVVWWLPAFARLLVRQDPGGFYEAVANFLAALVTAERALAGIEPAHQRPEPSPIETLDECSGCELAIR